MAVADRASGVHQTVLYGETSVLAGRKGLHRPGARLSHEALSRLRHVEVQVAPGRGYRELAKIYETLGIERTIAVTVPSFIAAAAVVSESDLVATLPSSLVERMGELLGLCVLKSPVPPVGVQIKLLWHQRTHKDPALRMFRELAAAALRPSD